MMPACVFPFVGAHVSQRNAHRRFEIYSLGLRRYALVDASQSILLHECNRLKRAAWSNILKKNRPNRSPRSIGRQ